MRSRSSIEVYDVGSLPPPADMRRIEEGARGGEDWEYFSSAVVRGLLDKIRAGADLPNFPQYRDMIEMFLELVKGVGRSEEGFTVEEPLRIRGHGIIPEVKAIEENAKEISEEIGGPIRLKICLTGPYALSYYFSKWVDRRWLIEELGNVLSEIASRNVISGPYLRVEMVSVDEPLVGVVDDPMLDRGGELREILISSLGRIFRACRSRGATTCIHLHSTSNPLFWEVEDLEVVESHVGDPLYSSRYFRRVLEDRDMFVKVSLAMTDFDRLVSEAAGGPEEAAECWRRIRKGELDPSRFLEPVDLMVRRLERAIDVLGEERVRYAGPECGMRGFPTYESALECLRRCSEAVRLVAQRER